jgi:hypothetical protein
VLINECSSRGRIIELYAHKEMLSIEKYSGNARVRGERIFIFTNMKEKQHRADGTIKLPGRKLTYEPWMM